MSAQELKELSFNELMQIPLAQKKLKEAEEQVNKYGDILNARHGNLKLKKFAVIALGFERVAYSSDPLWIITAYDPTLNPEEWDKNFKRRIKK